MDVLIKSIDLSRCRNEEHFLFMGEATKMVLAFTDVSVKMKGLINALYSLYNNEEEAITVLRKLESSETVNDADAARITVVRGMIKLVSSMMNFPGAEKRAAADRIHMVFDGYGLNASKLSGDKSVAINSIIKDLQNTHIDDAALIGLKDWTIELIAKQSEYEAAVAAGISEKAQKSQLRMKEVRTDIDAAYRALIHHIEAVIEVQGLNGYDIFVRELNVRIDKLNNTIAQRRGRNAKEDGKTDAPKS